jgi:hypothetical protein
MAAIDVIITLAIIIKIIDLFIIWHKKKNKAIFEDQGTTASSKFPILIVIVLIVIGIAATNQRETDPKPIQQVNQIPIAKYPAGFYMQPLLNTTTGIINQMGNTLIKNAELDRKFRSKYKSPAECKKPREMETIQKCTDHYRNARANFAKHKESVELNNNMEIIRLQKVIAARKQAREESMDIVEKPTRPRKTQPECFEKGTSKRVSCGDDYIIEKAAYAH